MNKAPDIQNLEGSTIRQIVTAAAPAKNLTQSVRQYATEIGISERGLWILLREGTRNRTPAFVKRCLLTDAQVHHVRLKKI